MSSWGYRTVAQCGWAGLREGRKHGIGEIASFSCLPAVALLSAPSYLGLRLKRLFLVIGVAPPAFAGQVTSPPEAWSAPSSSPSRPISATPSSQSTRPALAHYLESSIAADFVSADGHSLPLIACAVGHSWLWALP
jgi:hypothetical protein